MSEFHRYNVGHKKPDIKEYIYIYIYIYMCVLYDAIYVKFKIRKIIFKPMVIYIRIMVLTRRQHERICW